MDAIDITSSEFSLSNINIPDLEGDYLTDYIIYIYIAVAILGLVIIMFIYNFYINKQKHVTFQDKLDDCYGDSYYPQ